MVRKGISDLELLEYIAGRLSPNRTVRIDSLLAESEPARLRLQRFRRTWEAMGHWDVSADERDVLPAVMQRIESRRGRGVRFVLDWGATARIAATWIIAIASGVAAGRAVLSGRTPVPPADEAAPRQVLDADVADSLHLGVLGSGGSTGLAQSIFQVNGQDDEETEL